MLILTIVSLVVFFKILGFVLRAGFRLASLLLFGWVFLLVLGFFFSLTGGFFMVPFLF